MATFVFTYRMPAGYVPGGPGTMAAWAAWFNSTNCGAETRLGGYTFVTAGDLKSALALAKGSPALQAGGGVEAGAITVLNLDSASSGRG